MEGIVAKRCLRGTNSGKYLTKEKVNNINRLYYKTIRDGKKIEIDGNKKGINSLIFKMKIRLWIQFVNVLIIISLIIIVNMIDIASIDNNGIVKIMKEEYRKGYSQKQVFEFLKKELQRVILFVEPIVPDKVEKKIEKIYLDINKGSDTKAVQDKSIQIYEESSNAKAKLENVVNVNDKNLQIVKKEPEVAPKYIESVSAISTIDLNIQEIKDKNISFVKPTIGTVTSVFGAREQVFNDVESYHTGIDIAGKEGTKIVSSIDGKVIKVSENEYNGKFLEIENNNVITKYLHMSKVEVNQGKIVKAGELIGLMGSTGKSTGSHLHFEILINNVRVDPSKIISI